MTAGANNGPSDQLVWLEQISLAGFATQELHTKIPCLWLLFKNGKFWQHIHVNNCWSHRLQLLCTSLLYSFILLVCRNQVFYPARQCLSSDTSPMSNERGFVPAQGLC